MPSIGAFLTGVLMLGVNEQESRVVKTNSATLLGFTFRRKKLRWTDQAFDDVTHRIRLTTGRSWGVCWEVSMGYRLDKLARYARSWMNYFGIADHYRPVHEFDHCRLAASSNPHGLLKTVAS